MIIKTTANVMKKAIAVVSKGIDRPEKGVERKATTYIRIEAIHGNDGDITFTGTSDEYTIVEKVEKGTCDVGGTGAMIIDPRLITEALSTANANDEVMFANEGTQIIVKIGNAAFKLNAIAPEAFPLARIEKDGTPFVWKKEDLEAIFKNVGYACSNRNDARPIFMGVNIKSDGQKVTCTATDSYRLARREYDLAAPECNITVPAKALGMAAAFFANGEDVKIYAGDKTIVMEGEFITIQSRLYDGVFPDTSRLIPTGFTSILSVDRNILMGAAKRASMMKEEGHVHVRFKINEDECIVKAIAKDVGDYEETLAINGYSGEPLDIALDASYLKDALVVATGDVVTLNMNGSLKPVIVRGDDPEQLSLISAVRVH